MKKTALLLLVLALAIFGSINTLLLYKKSKLYGAPPYQDEGVYLNYSGYSDKYANWERPDGPIKIGLQVGHWKTDEMPKEQEKIKLGGGGTTGRGLAEWEVALKIAERTAETLRELGYKVDILPATVPEDYWADAFVSLHADGNLNPAVAGYKVAASQRDRTGDATKLSEFISEEYEDITGFSEDPNITRNMTRYYAFNSRRYKHAVHPMTPGVVVEMGFMTNYRESSILINQPNIPTEGIAQGIIKFIEYLDIDVD